MNPNIATLSLLFVICLGADATGRCHSACPTADDIDIQAKLDAIAAAGGGTLQLEPRVYQTCHAWIVRSNTHLRGAGRGATVIRGDQQFIGQTVSNSFATGTISTVGTANVTVSDLAIDHRTCNRSANGIAIFPAGIP